MYAPGCSTVFNPLNAELNPICHLLALLGAHHIFHVGIMRVNQKCLEIVGVLVRKIWHCSEAVF